MDRTITLRSPIDGSIVAVRTLASASEIALALQKSRAAQREWKAVPLSDRVALCRAFSARMLAQKETLGEEITLQMGRPIRYTPKEIQGMSDRAEYMASIAHEALAPIEATVNRYVLRDPVGVVFAIVPWNYPYLTAVNTLIPALIAGNSVILKHAPQTLLCAERIANAFESVGLPEGVFQFLHLTDEDAEQVIRSGDIDHVAFTGSVRVGRLVQEAASHRFLGVGLELGGKDPAYVRADADLASSIENVVDGAFFNSGQSCCAVERVYVHAAVYNQFIEGAVELTRGYVLGDPRESSTTLGPMVSASAAQRVRSQIRAAVSKGAKALIDESMFNYSRPDTAYLAPQILIGVDHSMEVMREESFGPVVGIMKVDSDQEAIDLMNDSSFGLTASVWTTDREAALEVGNRVHTGTVFMNRCDYLDPALAWTGVKESGRGCTLSKVGYEHLTRPKSFHLLP